MTNTAYQLDELKFESTLGERGIESDSTTIPIIDFTDFEQRRDEITEVLWQAATQVGFFQIKNHSISLQRIQQAFGLSEKFFALPASQKRVLPLKQGLNAGWEFKAQVRPSTGTADQKESYQVTLPHMQGLWPSEKQVPQFKTHILEFEHEAWKLGMGILSCFADKLGFDHDFFAKVHQRQSAHYQSTLRMLHYLPMDTVPQDQNHWRAGAHTDFDCLTMVFQQQGQGGLQVAAGKDSQQQQTWSNVIPQTEIITCNIGDMLMRWSDDQLKSTLHRVRMPYSHEPQGSRYSMAFFCQANKDVMIQGAQKKYPPITAADYLKMRINANFAK